MNALRLLLAAIILLFNQCATSANRELRLFRNQQKGLATSQRSGFFSTTTFCRRSSDGLYENAERLSLLRIMFRFLPGWTEGSCGNLCSELCNHVECMDDLTVSSNGASCQCAANAASASSMCGEGASCVEDTCKCPEGLQGDPLDQCSTSQPTPLPTPATTPLPAPATTTLPTPATPEAKKLTKAKFCIEGGDACPENLICCETTDGSSCKAPAECCANGERFDSLCGCMAEDEVCCGDLTKYKGACPCEVIGGKSCPVGLSCLKRNRGLSGSCEKQGTSTPCTDSISCGDGEQCCSGTCIGEDECCGGCNTLTEKCCSGSCILQSQCCVTIDGNTCDDGTCANNPENENRCCEENVCGDICCSNEEICRADLTCVPRGKNCSRLDPCCNPLLCTESAGVFGDPHVETFDGLGFDCQAAGEFVLAQSVNTSFKVNGFVKEASSNELTVSVLNGIAIQPSGIDEPLIQLLVDERAIRIWVGGNEVNEAEGFLSDTLEVTKATDSIYEVYFKDASIAISLLQWKSLVVMNFVIQLKKDKDDAVIGLLGTPDGNRNNDWVEMFFEANKYSDELAICANEIECASKMATDYCMTNWCVSDQGISLFVVGGINFFNETGCRAPLAFQTTVDDLRSRRLQTDVELESLCGGELACLLDYSLFGYEAANSTVAAQTDLLDSLIISASPNRLAVNETIQVAVTLTLAVNQYDSLVALSTDGSLSFLLYVIDDASGDKYSLLTSVMEKQIRTSRSNAVEFLSTVSIFAETVGKFYGFEAVPIINGSLRNALTFSRGRACRSYKDSDKTVSPTPTPTRFPTTISPATDTPATSTPTTATPTTFPTTESPSSTPITALLTSSSPATGSSTLKNPTTASPTTSPTTVSPSTATPATSTPSTATPTAFPTTEYPPLAPLTASVTSRSPTTDSLPTRNPTPASPTPTRFPTTNSPATDTPATSTPTTATPTSFPTAESPSSTPITALPTSISPATGSPTTRKPTMSPMTISPTTYRPTTPIPSNATPTAFPTTVSPWTAPPSYSPTSSFPTNISPTTNNPTPASPTTSPTTLSPNTTNPTTATPTTTFPTTESPSLAPTSPTTSSPSTRSPTTNNPTPASPTTSPTTLSPTTTNPTTATPTTAFPTTEFPSLAPTSASPTTSSPSTRSPASGNPTTTSPTTSPTTISPTTTTPTTATPTTVSSTTESPSTPTPSYSPTSSSPSTRSPTTNNPTPASPTMSPTTLSPTTTNPTTKNPTTAFPTTESPSLAPTTASPTTSSPVTRSPTTRNPTTSSPTSSPTTLLPTTVSPTTAFPTTTRPSTAFPTTAVPSTGTPTTASPTSHSPTTASPTPVPLSFLSNVELRVAVEDYLSANEFATTTYGFPIGSWNVSAVTNFSGIFANTMFNESINNWDVSQATTMSGMFHSAIVFDQDLDLWSVGSVTDMSYMFYNASAFSGNIGTWNVLSVEFFTEMFRFAASFNSTITSWRPASAFFFGGMFQAADSFGMDLCGWGPYFARNFFDTDHTNMFSNSSCPVKTDPNNEEAPGFGYVDPMCYSCTQESSYTLASACSGSLAEEGLLGGTVIGDTTNSVGPNVQIDLMETYSGEFWEVIGNGYWRAASTCGDYTTFEAQITVFSGNFSGTCGDLTAVEYFSSQCGLQSYVQFFTIENEFYYILVHGTSPTSRGAYELEVRTILPS